MPRYNCWLLSVQFHVQLIKVVFCHWGAQALLPSNSIVALDQTHYSAVYCSIRTVFGFQVNQLKQAEEKKRMLLASRQRGSLILHPWWDYQGSRQNNKGLHRFSFTCNSQNPCWCKERTPPSDCMEVYFCKLNQLSDITQQTLNRQSSYHDKSNLPHVLI